MDDNSTITDPERFQFYAIPDIKSLHDGERMYIDIDGQPIVIFNLAGTYYAIGDECTHDEGSLGEGQVEGHIVTCPRHGACYDIRTGEMVDTIKHGKSRVTKQFLLRPAIGLNP